MELLTWWCHSVSLLLPPAVRFTAAGNIRQDGGTFYLKVDITAIISIITTLAPFLELPPRSTASPLT